MTPGFLLKRHAQHFRTHTRNEGDRQHCYQPFQQHDGGMCGQQEFCGCLKPLIRKRQGQRRQYGRQRHAEQTAAKGGRTQAGRAGKEAFDAL